MAGILSQQLSELKRQLYLANLNNESFKTKPYLVIFIHRYLSDPRHCVQTGLTSTVPIQDLANDVIQLTVADEKYKLKIILTPALNKLVQSAQVCKTVDSYRNKFPEVEILTNNSVRYAFVGQDLHFLKSTVVPFSHNAGHEISITKGRLHHDETDLSSSQVVVVEELQIVGQQSRTNTDVGQLLWLPDSCVTDQMDIPLTSSRGYYISIWSSMEMYGNIWKTTVPMKPCLDKVSLQDIYSIKDLARKWNSIKSANPAVLARVLMKSRILHYAKPHKNDKWPFQAHVLVGDESGTCTLVLWNAMCPQLYYSLKEGTMLLLQKFTVKKSFQLATRFKQAMKGRDNFDIDINLNSHHPVSEVTIVDPATIPDQINLPSVTYNFVNRLNIGSLVVNCKCDVVGVVTYIGRYEREPLPSRTGRDWGGFWVRRWLHLVDGSSKKPFVIQLYKATQCIDDLDIVPGSKLICSHMRVIHHLELVDNSRRPHSIYLTSTAETQAQILDADLQAALQDYEIVRDAVRWSATQQCQDMVKRATYGGYYNVPVMYRSVGQLKTFIKDLQIVGSEEWEKLLSGFSYRESRQILIKANMVHVKAFLTSGNRYTLWPGIHQPKNTRSSQVGAKLQLENAVDDAMSALLEKDDMKRYGAQQIDPELSNSIRYSPDHSAAIKNKFLFPPCEVGANGDGDRVSEDDLQFIHQPYFTVTWVGLNAQILLHTHFFCPSTISRETKLLDIICEQPASQISAEPSVQCKLTSTDTEQLVNSATQCSGRQFVLMIDCYQDRQQKLEIFLNRAWPLTSS